MELASCHDAGALNFEKSVDSSEYTSASVVCVHPYVRNTQVTSLLIYHTILFSTPSLIPNSRDYHSPLHKYIRIFVRVGNHVHVQNRDSC
jgi:hypothetical protein